MSHRKFVKTELRLLSLLPFPLLPADIPDYLTTHTHTTTHTPHIIMITIYIYTVDSRYLEFQGTH